MVHPGLLEALSEQISGFRSPSDQAVTSFRNLEVKGSRAHILSARLGSIGIGDCYVSGHR
jgi:hypothetical protein